MDIFKYYDISLFLKEVFESKKKENPKFSLRYWSNKLGVSSAGAFNQMINGKRAIPAKLIPRISNSLDFETSEMIYFKELYFISKKTNNEQEKIKYLQEFNPYHWKKKHTVTDKKVLLSPLFFALKTLLKRKKNLPLKFNEVRKVLSKDIDNDDIKNALKIIRQSEISKEEDSKRWVTTTDKVDSDVQRIHQYYLELAKKRVSSSVIDNKEFNSHSINIKPEHLPQIKDRIRYFTDTLIEEFDHDNETSETFQFGSYLYSLTGESK